MGFNYCRKHDQYFPIGKHCLECLTACTPHYGDPELLRRRKTLAYGQQVVDSSYALDIKLVSICVTIPYQAISSMSVFNGYHKTYLVVSLASGEEKRYGGNDFMSPAVEIEKFNLWLKKQEESK